MIAKFIAGAAIAALVAGTAAAQTPERSADDEMAFDIFQHIVAMRTAEGQGKTPAMAEYLAGKFKAAGFADDDVEIVPSGETAGLIVTYKGDGSSGKKPILLLAHMDVVDARPEDWELDPFKVTEKDGYYFGRGVTDNKYGVANLTQTFIRLKRDGFTPNRDLIIAFSGDEETGMTSTRALVERLKSAEYALNTDAGGGSLGPDGEPLVFSLQAAEKTYATFEVTATNPGGHSSRPRPDNAIYDLADAIEKIRALKFPVMSNEITLGSFAAMGPKVGGELGKAMSAFGKNPDDKKAAATIAADPSYIGMTRTTCVPTMLSAGHAENALPQSATATVNCRIFPSQNVDAVKTALAGAIDNDALTINVLDEPTVSPVSEPRDDVMAALADAVHQRYPDLPIVPYMESGGTDGMHYRIAGVPTWAMSALFMKESDMYAHGLNERIPVEAFYDGLDQWSIILRDLAGSSADE